MATAKMYSNFFHSAMHDQVADLNGSANVYIALFTDTYTPDQNNDVVWDDIDGVGNELVDASYTAGGYALAGVTFTQSNLIVKLDATDHTFSNLSGTFRYAVIYDKTTGVPATEPLICYIDLTGANVTVAAQDYKLVWNASGICTHTAS